MIKDLDNEQIEAASPASAFDAYNGEVKSAVKVLKEEAGNADSDWMEEELEAVALYLENEVLN